LAGHIARPGSGSSGYDYTRYISRLRPQCSFIAVKRVPRQEAGSLHLGQVLCILGAALHWVASSPDVSCFAATGCATSSPPLTLASFASALSLTFQKDRYSATGCRVPTAGRSDSPRGACSPRRQRPALRQPARPDRGRARSPRPSATAQLLDGLRDLAPVFVHRQRVAREVLAVYHYLLRHCEQLRLLGRALVLDGLPKQIEVLEVLQPLAQHPCSEFGSTGGG